MDSTSLTTASVAEISRLRADKALGEFIGGPEEAPVSGGLRAGSQSPWRFGEPPLPVVTGQLRGFPIHGHANPGATAWMIEKDKFFDWSRIKLSILTKFE